MAPIFKAIMTLLFICLFQQASANENMEGMQAQFVGLTVYEPTDLLTFAAAHASQSDEAATIEAVAEAIELIYREDGYFLAEVAYTMSNSEVIFYIYEGWIETIVIEGATPDLASRISGYLSNIINVSPLAFNQYERKIMLINDLEGIEVSVEIEHPSHQQGSLLRVHVHEVEPYSYIVVDNPPREFADSVTAVIGHETYSLFTPGDLARINIGYSHYADEGGGDGFIGNGFYQLPIGDDGLYVEGFLSSSYAKRDATGALNDTQITGFTGGILSGYPLLRDTHSFHYLLGEFRHSEADSETINEDFEGSATTLSISYLAGWTDQHGAPLHLSITFTGGVAEDPVTLTREEADDSFWHLRFGIGMAQPLHFIDSHTAIRAEVWGQYTSSKLPTVEEFYLGERDALRGYAFAELVGDYGVNASLELSHEFLMPGRFIWRLVPFVYLDAGYTDVNDDAFSNDIDSLYATGIGADANFVYGISASTYIGIPLKDGPFTDSGSHAVYLRATKVW